MKYFGPCEILGFYGDKYEDYSFLEYGAVWSRRPTFQRCVLLPSSRHPDEDVRTSETSLIFHDTTRAISQKAMVISVRGSNPVTSNYEGITAEFSPVLTVRVAKAT
jgi:hypothetical protein